MKLLTGYIFLTVAISCGIAANSFAKISDGFTKLTPSVACILLMCVTMFSLAKGMSVIPVGFAYATYSATQVAAILLFGIIYYKTKIHGETTTEILVQCIEKPMLVNVHWL